MLRLRLLLMLPPMIIIVLLLSFSCSSMKGNPVAPVDVVETQVQAEARETADMYVGGLWQVVLNKNTGTVDVNRLRGADLALNALGLIERADGALGDISITINEINPAAGHVDVDVTISHQFYSGNGKLNVFDVRGIVFGADLVNADGYTPLLRPSDFGDVPMGYISGEMGTAAYLTGFSGVAYPYKYFADGLAANQELFDFFSNSSTLTQRGVSTEGSVNTRRYDMYLNTDANGNLIFNYAVLVNHDLPTGNPPYDLNDFPLLTANCAEPFCIDYDIIQNALYFDPLTGVGVGMISLDIEVYDWQNLGGIAVTIESPGLLSPITASTYGPGSTFKSGVFSFDNVILTPTSLEPVDIIVTARDTAVTFGESFFHDFLPETHALYNEPAYISTVLTLDVLEPKINEKNLYLLSGVHVPEENFTFVMWGDVQDGGIFPDVAAKINELNPTFSIGLGDYVQLGTQAEYDAFIPQLALLEQPLMSVVGNHDYTDFTDVIWVEEFGATNYSFDFGGVRFICLDNAELTLDEMELAFLEVKLDTQMPTVVCAHVPPDYDRWSVHCFTRGSDEFLGLLAECRADYAFFGHIHLFDEEVIGPTQCVITGGAGGQLYSQYGFGIPQFHVTKVTVTPSGITHQYVPIY